MQFDHLWNMTLNKYSIIAYDRVPAIIDCPLHSESISYDGVILSCAMFSCW